MSYVKQTWATGNVVTAAKLNHMEDGIAAADGKASPSVHLSCKKTHAGVELRTSVGNYDGKFMVLPLQDFQYKTEPNKLYYLCAYAVPEEYLGRCSACIYVVKHTEPITNLITKDAPGVTRATGSKVLTDTTRRGFYGVNVSFSEANYNTGTVYVGLRPAIEIYTTSEKTELERVVYGEQVNYHNTSFSPFVVEVLSRMSETNPDDDVVWGGYIANSVGAKSITTVNSDSYLQRVSQLVNSVNTIATDTDLRVVLPYSSIDAEANPYLVAVIREGKEIITSNLVVNHELDTTAKRSVSAGDIFLLDDLWYKATSDIYTGDSIVVGTNAAAVDDPSFFNLVDVTPAQVYYSTTSATPITGRLADFPSDADITDEQISVTLDGVTYTAPRSDNGGTIYYGNLNGEDYPFLLLYTSAWAATIDTPSSSITIAGKALYTPTEAFKGAVKNSGIETTVDSFAAEYDDLEGTTIVKATAGDIIAKINAGHTVFFSCKDRDGVFADVACVVGFEDNAGHGGFTSASLKNGGQTVTWDYDSYDSNPSTTERI